MAAWRSDLFTPKKSALLLCAAALALVGAFIGCQWYRPSDMQKEAPADLSTQEEDPADPDTQEEVPADLDTLEEVPANPDTQEEDPAYWHDGEVLTLNEATIGNGVNIVLVGDGFGHEDLAKGGYWETVATKLGQQFLDIPVVRDLHAYFNVYILMSESPLSNTGMIVNGDYNPNLGPGKSKFGLDDWGLMKDTVAAMDEIGNIEEVAVIYISNGAIGGYALGGGGNFGWAVFSLKQDWPQIIKDGLEIANLSSGPTSYWMEHELAGHAFGAQSDEYYWDWTMPGDFGHTNGAGLNMHCRDGDWTLWPDENPNRAAPWTPLIGQAGYEAVGYHGSGGNFHAEDYSVMIGSGGGYSAMNRYSIWMRTMVRAGVHPLSWYLTDVTFTNDGNTAYNQFITPEGLADFRAYDTVNYNSSLPALMGTVTVTTDQTVLTANTASLGGSGNIIYTWQQASSSSGPWTNIPGAAGLTKDVVSEEGNVYYVRAADAGKYIRVRTSRVGYKDYVDSDAAGPIPPFPALSGSVSISGAYAMGKTLSVNTSGLDGSGELLYVWHRGFTDYAGTFFVAQKRVEGQYVCETGSTLTLKSTDEFQTNDSGRYVRVLVRRKGYTGYVRSPIVGG